MKRRRIIILTMQILASAFIILFYQNCGTKLQTGADLNGIGSASLGSTGDLPLFPVQEIPAQCSTSYEQLSCAAPPIGCEIISRPTNAQGCPLECGTLACTADAPVCKDRVVQCAAPPEGCFYDATQASHDSSGCPRDCGLLVCPAQ